MADGQHEVFVRVTGDASEFVGEAEKAGASQRKFDSQLAQSGQTAKRAADDSKNFVEQTRALEAATARAPVAMQSAARAAGIYGASLLAAGAGVALLVAQSERFERSQRGMELALLAQGRSSEISREQLAGLTREIATLPGMASDSAAQTITAFVRMRQIGGAALGDLSRISVDYAAVTGQQVPAAAGRLAAAFADPARGARDLDRELNILSVSQVLLIERLTQQGDTVRAQQVLYDALRDRVSGLAEQGVTPLERSAERLGQAWSTLMGRMADTSAITAAAYGLERIVAAGAWIIENAAKIDASRAALAITPGFQMLGMGIDSFLPKPEPMPASQRDVRAVDQQIWTQQQEEIKRALQLANTYDRVGAKQRELEGARAQLASALQVTENPEAYNRLAAGLAAVDEELKALLVDQRELERLRALGEKSDTDYLLAQQKKLDDRDDQIRAEFKRLQKERKDLEELGRKEETEYLLGQQRRLEERDEATRNAELKRIKGERDAEERARRQFERTAEHMERALTDSLMRGFESGAEGAEVLKRSMEATFKTALLEPMLRPVMMPMATSMTAFSQGIFGTPGARPGDPNQGGLGPYLAMLGPVAATAAAMYYLRESGTGRRWSESSAAETLPGRAFFGGTIAGNYISGGGPRGREGFVGGGLGAIEMGSTEWFGGTANAQTRQFIELMNEREQNLLRNLGITDAQRAAVNASLGAGRTYGFGSTDSTPAESGAFQVIEMERLKTISEVLGESIEELTEIMSTSAEQWEAARRMAQDQLAAIARALPGQLGITGLKRYQDSLATAEFNAPLDRLAAARGIFEERLARSRTGDLEAVQDLPQAVQAMLAIARDVYASGPQFQEIQRVGSEAIVEAINRQQDLQNDIMREVPAAILQASNDQVAAIREQTDALVAQLERLDLTVRRERA